MATVEGIRTPIVLDLTDIPKSVAHVIKEVKKLKKTVGDVHIKLEGKHINDLSRKSIKPLIKDFAALEFAANKAKASIRDIGAAMKKIHAGADIGKGLSERVAAAKGVGPQTREAMQAYKSAAAGVAGAPGSEAKQEKLIAAQKKLVDLLRKAERVNKRTADAAIKSMDVQLQLAKRRSTFRREEIAENKKLHREYLKQYRLLKKGNLTQQERIRLSELANKVQQRGLHQTKKQVEALRKVHREAKKAGKAGAGLMGQGFLGRVKWFAQLRILWGMLTVIGKVTEEMLQLDRATARAMRTMVRGVKEYDKVAKKVRKTIIETAKLTGATYEDIGEALYQLSSAGLTANEALAAVASTVKLATLTESNMTDTTKVVAGAYNNFKDRITDVTSETEKFMKISGTLSYVWKRNQIDMNELVQGLNQSAQSGKLAGLKFEELSVILGNMGTRMIRSGRAGRMLRSAVINIAQKSEKVKEVFDVVFDPSKPMDFVDIVGQMAAKWKESNKSMATTAAVFDIFGKRGAPAIISILDSWDKVKKEMDGVNNVMDLMIEQHEALLKTQTHYKQLTEVMWKNVLGWVAEYFDYTSAIKGIIRNISESADRAKMVKEAKKTTTELSETFTGSGSAMEKIIDVQAKYNLAIAAGYSENEVFMKSMSTLLVKLKLLKQAYDEEDKAQAKVVERKTENLMTTDNLRVGYAMADNQLDDWNVMAGKTKSSLEDLGKKGKAAFERLKDAREDYARAHVMATKGLAAMPKEIESELKKANREYVKLKEMTEKLRAEIYADQVAAQLATGEGFGGQEAADKAKGMKAEAEGATRRASWLKLQSDFQLEEMAHKRELAEIELGEDERFQARNMSKREQDELDRLREQEKLENQALFIEKELELNLMRQNAEEIAADKAIDPEQRQKHLDNLNQLQVREQDLQRMNELNQAQQLKAGESYDTYQKKRIAGIAKEKGAVAASKEMWKAYGDTIGSYASKMADQVKNMFAEMGKESKGAWDVYKAIAISQAIIDTYKTAQAGASALAGIPFVGPALAGMWIATSVMSGMMRVQQIRSQKPQKAARGGVFDGSLGIDSYASGGVTRGPATGIIGDNPSGKELVIPSENITRNHVEGEVREAAGAGEPVQVINMVTQGDIAQAMSESEEGKNVVINHIGRDMNEKGSTYHTMKKSNKKEQ